MMANDTFTAKWSDKRMEEDEGLRTMECLRGRLLAERAASKAANDESEQIGKKVVELEKQLQIEIKSRNKAEKRLKFLLKKLDSLNISYVSTDESSSFSEKSEISSVSSSSRSQYQMELQKTQFSMDEVISGDSNADLIQSSQKDGGKDALNKDENNGFKFRDTKNIDNGGHDHEDTYYNVDNSMALVMVEEKVNTKKEHDKYHNDSFENSMAIVVVDSIAKEEKQEIPISNGSVKDVLEALRYAKESLQTSMEMRRHMRSNITQARFNGISC